MDPAPSPVLLRDARFDDVDALAEHLAGWDLDLTPLGGGRFNGGHALALADGVLIQEGKMSLPLLQRGGVPPHPTFVVPSQRSGSIVFRGQEARADRIMVVRPGGELHAHTGAGFHVWTLSVPEEALRATAGAFDLEAGVAAALGGSVLRPHASLLAGLRRSVRRALALARGVAPRRYRGVSPAPLLRSLVWALGSAATAEPVPKVEIAEALCRRVQVELDRDPSAAPTVPELALAAGTSERTLRRAVQLWYGASPQQLVRYRRLHRARRELLRANPSRRTVTAVAMRWNFPHLGRFAGEYHRMFGEHPSETLARGAGVG